MSIQNRKISNKPQKRNKDSIWHLKKEFIESETEVILPRRYIDDDTDLISIIWKHTKGDDENSSSKTKLKSGALSEFAELMKLEVMQSDMITSMLSNVVENAKEEVKIIGTQYTMGRPETKCALFDFTLEEKCTKPMFELHDYPTYLLGQNDAAYSRYKFEVDRSYIEQVLTSIAKEIMKKRTVTSGLLEHLKKVVNSNNEEEKFLKEVSQKTRTISDTRKTRYLEKSDYNIKINAINDDIAFRQNLYQDMMQENEVKEEYIDKWEKSRNRQNKLKYSQIIEKLHREIKDYQSKIQRENRVNVEVEKYTNLVRFDTVKSIKSWSIKYEAELEETDNKVQDLRVATQILSENMADLKKKYQEQTDFIEKGRTLHKELVAKKALLAKQADAALRIQAWWRGVRVRRGIASLKKKKKRAGKKDAKNVDRK